MNRLASHKIGNHDGALVQECPVCDAAAAYFMHWGESWSREAEARAIAEAEADEGPGDDWTEDEEGHVMAPLSYLNVEGDPTRNGAFR